MIGVVVWIFKKVNTFPQKQRFVLGQQIENSTLRCLRLIVEANDTDDKERKINKLNLLNIELEVLRSLLRVALELKFITAKSLSYVISEIDEVGRMRGSWIKRQKHSSLSKKLS